MQIVHGSSTYPEAAPRLVLAIGNFDGVHLGHQELFLQARREALARGCACGVLTFEPHPARLLAHELCPPLITTLEQKLTLFAENQLDAAIVEPFTREFAALSPERFVADVLVHNLRTLAIVVGHDFTFGQHRSGSIECLRHLAAEYGVETIVIPATFAQETLISSSLIRRLIAQGDVERASFLLGRPYTLEGHVVSGRGIGGSLGAHTANLASINELIPMRGVYLTRVRILSATGPCERASITSIGDNPTFTDGVFTIETHVIDFTGDLVGSSLTIEFLDYLRPQQRFSSPEALREQIARDIDEARKRHRPVDRQEEN